MLPTLTPFPWRTSLTKSTSRLTATNGGVSYPGIGKVSNKPHRLALHHRFRYPSPSDRRRKTLDAISGSLDCVFLLETTHDIL